MKIATDNNIFILQKFGGISRLFSDYLENNIIQTKLSLPILKPSLNFRQRIFRKLKLKTYNFNGNYENIINKSNCNLYHPSYYGAFDPLKLKIPYIITVYDMIHELFPEIFNINVISNQKLALLPFAKRIIAISETTKRDIINVMGINEENIDVVPLYTCFGEIQSIKPQVSLPPNFILYVGGRGYYKNFKRFIDAASIILKKHSNLNLVCTGNGFDEVEKSYFEKLEIKNRVFTVLCQNDNQLKYLYENAECFVFPSLYEGFGFPLLEAFASNCPVISSNTGSLPEVGGNACLYFDPLNVKEIADKIDLIFNNSLIRKELILNGKERLKNYSLKNTMDLTQNCYKKALGF